MVTLNRSNKNQNISKVCKDELIRKNLQVQSRYNDENGGNFCEIMKKLKAYRNRSDSFLLHKTAKFITTVEG